MGRFARNLRHDLKQGRTMTGLIRNVTAAAVAILLASLASARADEIDKATQDQLQKVITDQLDAFAHEDADRAESFAAPGIKQHFPDAKDFVAMVHQAYAPLFQPRSTHFDKTGSTALGPIQAVTIVDRDGQAWTALYTFEEVEGQWRINGCVLVKEQSTTI